MNTTVRSIGTDPFRLLFGTKAQLQNNFEIRRLIKTEWIEALFQGKRDELRERGPENVLNMQ